MTGVLAAVTTGHGNGGFEVEDEGADKSVLLVASAEDDVLSGRCIGRVPEPGPRDRVCEMDIAVC